MTTTKNEIDLVALFAECAAELTVARLAAEAKDDADLAAYKRDRRANSRIFHENLRLEAGGKKA